MHQFEITRFGAGAADLLDHAEADAAAAVHRHAGRLVDYQHGIVFIHNLKFARGRSAAFRRPLLFGNAYRRNAQHIALSKAVGAFAALFVEPHFAGADDALDVAFGHTFQNLDEIVVEPLAGIGFGDIQMIDQVFANCRHFLYNPKTVFRVKAQYINSALRPSENDGGRQKTERAGGANPAQAQIVNRNILY